MSQQHRMAMVDGQLRTNKITDTAIIDLFSSTPREDFAPDGLKGAAYVDEDLDLGQGRVLMDPLVAARLLQFSDVTPGMSVLVVGAANGYLPRLLVDLGAQVTAWEVLDDFASQGKQLAPEATWIVQGFDVLPEGTFDRILAGGALASIPSQWGAGLGENGRILTPILGERGNDGRLVEARAQGTDLVVRTLCNAAVPALPEFLPDSGFEF